VEDFINEQGKMKTKFSLDRKVELKKSFKLSPQILVRVVTKFAKTFCRFCMARMNVSEMQQIFNKIFYSV